MSAHEVHGRFMKAIRLADLLDAAEITAEAANSMKAAEWLLASRAAGSKLPSTATRELAVTMLRSREAARALFTAAVQGSSFAA